MSVSRHVQCSTFFSHGRLSFVLHLVLVVVQIQDLPLAKNLNKTGRKHWLALILDIFLLTVHKITRNYIQQPRVFSFWAKSIYVRTVLAARRSLTFFQALLHSWLKTVLFFVSSLIKSRLELWHRKNWLQLSRNFYWRCSQCACPSYTSLPIFGGVN